MAIGPGGQVTTTGLMGGQPKMPDVPDTSGLDVKNPNEMKSAGGLKVNTPENPEPVTPMVRKPEEPPVNNPQIDERIQNLSEIEVAQLDGILSPSNAAIFKKIAPEASGVIDQFTSNEEIIALPVSVVKNFAIKKYPGNSEQESVQGFITELSESTSDDNNVPPENMQASNPNGMMAQEPDTSETDAIDQGLV